MSINTAAWGFDQYMAFLLVHCAFADHHVTEEEADYLEHKFENVKLGAIRKIYAQSSDEEKKELIEAFKTQFLGHADKKAEALAHIQSLFASDDKVSKLELELKAELEALIG